VPPACASLMLAPSGMSPFLETVSPRRYVVRMASTGRAHPLRQRDRPEFEVGDRPIRLVDLFSGCGGLTLGVGQAAFAIGRALDVQLAVDFDANATAVFETNFPKADVRTVAVESLFGGELGGRLTRIESRLRDVVEADVLVGGPPCQGHSDLNNHTRRQDPKNSFYLRMARAAEVLRPSLVIVENVPAVRHDRERVVDATRDHLARLGYDVADAVLSLDRLGVAQRRRRHVLLATLQSLPAAPDILSMVALRQDRARDLRWAIGDLATAPAKSHLDVAPTPSKANLERMQWLLREDQYNLPNRLRPPCHRGDHSYKSMYGRLCWDDPAPTITSGFGCIGQGRYMHPDQARALTVHEAARIQGFPDYFDFSVVGKRTALATLVGNAAPPSLAKAVVELALA
jgi:DNA (cytosine-5)-methyltransferase 1